MTSPALISRGSPGNWRFHAPKEPPLLSTTIRPGSVGRTLGKSQARRDVGTLGYHRTKLAGVGPTRHRGAERRGRRGGARRGGPN
eukprot:14419647-Alexandrium_andersonii.AAC.1